MGTWPKDAKGLTIIELVVTLCLIGILIGVVIPKYQRLAHEAQEAALKMGLANIRTSIRLFRILNERNPGSLNELIEQKVIMPARSGGDYYPVPATFDEKYLVAQTVDSQGRLLDPFGGHFVYDAVHGDVKASTKGYERW